MSFWSSFTQHRLLSVSSSCTFEESKNQILTSNFLKILNLNSEFSVENSGQNQYGRFVSLLGVGERWVAYWIIPMIVSYMCVKDKTKQVFFLPHVIKLLVVMLEQSNTRIRRAQSFSCKKKKWQFCFSSKVGGGACLIC